MAEPLKSASEPTPCDDGVDVTLIRWMLSLSPEERLAVLQGFVDSVAELTDAPRLDSRMHFLETQKP